MAFLRRWSFIFKLFLKLKLLCDFFFAFFISLNFGVQKHAMSFVFPTSGFVWKFSHSRNKTPLKLDFKLYFGCLFKLLASSLGKLCTQLVIIVFFWPCPFWYFGYLPKVTQQNQFKQSNPKLFNHWNFLKTIAKPHIEIKRNWNQTRTSPLKNVRNHNLQVPLKTPLEPLKLGNQSKH